MLPENKNEFVKLLKATLEVYGQALPSSEVIRIWWSALLNFDIANVRASLDEHIRKSKFSPRPADILEILNSICSDGRPGADEAWAMIPRDEQTSVVMNQEMSEALGIVQPLLDEGDQVAARMAFKEAYTRIVDANKRNGIKPKWYPSLGHEPSMREQVLKDAVRLGRLPASQAIAILPGIVPANLVIEDKRGISAEQAMENIARIKALIGNTNIAQKGLHDDSPN